jgi:hypothetical protein
MRSACARVFVVVCGVTLNDLLHLFFYNLRTVTILVSGDPKLFLSLCQRFNEMCLN